MRVKLMLLALLCIILSPLLCVAIFIEAAFGSESRALDVERSFDITGNEALGGTIGLTVSSCVGNGLVRGKEWAIILSYMIDLIMGKGHCLANATIK